MFEEEIDIKQEKNDEQSFQNVCKVCGHNASSKNKCKLIFYTF